MIKENIHRLHFINNISKYFLLIILFFYWIYSFVLSSYETLFIDERILIDDIYNVWLLDDIFNRYENINNSLVKKLAILLTEIAYGGDLRYGRLWPNFFTLISGPLTLLSDNAVIVFTRLINSLVFFLGNFLLVRTLLKKEVRWIALLTLYSIPAVEYLHRVPKPDSFLLIFIALGLQAFNDKKYYRVIFFLGIATFIKINTAVLFCVFVTYLFFKTKEKKIKFIFKSIFVTFLSLFLVNPILLIPPIGLSKYSVPNFYKIYFNWITTQGSHGESIGFSMLSFKAWIATLGNHYLVKNNIITILFLVILFLVIIKNLINYKNPIIYLLTLSSFLYIFFYFFFIERQFIHYLSLPFTILVLTIFSSANLKESKTNYLKFTFIILFVSIGIFSNLNRHIADKNFNANSRYGYENIYSETDAIRLVDKVLVEIIEIYKNKNFTKNIVAWHPDLFLPRNKVSYSENFFVREYWGSKDSADLALLDYDVFVTYTNYNVNNSIVKVQVENLFIYFLK